MFYVMYYRFTESGNLSNYESNSLNNIMNVFELIAKYNAFNFIILIIMNVYKFKIKVNEIKCTMH